MVKLLNSQFVGHSGKSSGERGIELGTHRTCSAQDTQLSGSWWSPSYRSNGAAACTALCQTAETKGHKMRFTWRNFFQFSGMFLFWLRGWRPSPHHGLLEVVGFNAADEIWLARSQCSHQGIQGLAELAAQSWHAFLAFSCWLLIQIKCNYVEIIIYSDGETQWPGSNRLHWLGGCLWLWLWSSWGWRSWWYQRRWSVHDETPVWGVCWRISPPAESGLSSTCHGFFQGSLKQNRNTKNVSKEWLEEQLFGFKSLKCTLWVIEDLPSKMLDSKLCRIVVLWGNVDAAFLMNLVHLLEQGGICALKTKLDV